MPTRRFPEVPADHPFSKFLEDLEVDVACPASPDHVTAATHTRIYVEWKGVAFMARRSKFRDLLLRARLPIDIVNDGYTPEAAYMIIYLFGTRDLGGGRSTRFPIRGAISYARTPATPVTFANLAPHHVLGTEHDPEEATVPEEPPKKLKGVKQMITY